MAPGFILWAVARMTIHCQEVAEVTQATVEGSINKEGNMRKYGLRGQTCFLVGLASPKGS